MKSISDALKAHLSSETLTVATLWRVTRTDGSVFAFTDHDQDISFGGLVYLASTGYTPSSVETASALNVDNMEIQGVLTSETITDIDLAAGMWDYALIEVFLVNYMDLSMGGMWIRKGRLGEVKTGRVAFTAELRGMMQNLQQTIGRIYTPACNADFGDARCKMDKPAWTVSGTVSSINGASQFDDASRTEATGHFDGGLLTWTSGPNAGAQMEVKMFTSPGSFILQEAMIRGIAVGDEYSVSAGCDKTLATCKARFSNVINFRGFPYLPGKDRVMSGK